MTRDVTEVERRVAARAATTMGDYRAGLKIGFQLVVQMATFFVLFYVLGRGRSADPAHHAAWGVGGVMVGVVVEIGLLVSREVYPLQKRHGYREKYEALEK